MNMQKLRELVVLDTGQTGYKWESFVINTYKIHGVVPAHSLHSDFQADESLLCYITFAN